MAANLLRTGTLGGALLASTFLTAPAFAQTGQTVPPDQRGIDANGVDLIDGSFPFTLVEGTIGSGEAMLAVTRTGSSPFGTSNWQNVYAEQTISGGTTTVIVILGDRSERFTSTGGGGFVSALGSGATLTGGNHADFTYRDPSGVTVVLGAPIADQGGASNLCSHINADQNNCRALATSITRPDSAQLSFGWDVHSNCSTIFNPDGSLDCTYSWRLDTVGNSYGYAVDFDYVSNSVPPQQNPSGDWFRRSGATLTNSAVSGTSSSIVYAYVSSSVTDVTDIGGRTWRLTGAGASLTGVRRPGSSADDISIAYAGGAVSSVTRDGVTTNYSHAVSGSTATWTITYLDGNPGTTDPQSTVVVNLAIGRITSVTDPLGRTTAYQYDGSGRLTRVTRPEGNYTQLTYDSRGNVTETRMVGKSGSGVPDTVSTASFPSTCTNLLTCNQPDSVTDARGNTTDFTYDGTHGGVLTVTAPAPTAGATRPQTRLSYTLTNGEYQLTSVSACASGSAPTCEGTSDETRSVVAYDANGNVTSLEQRSGNISGSGAISAANTMTYDGYGNMLALDGPLSGSADTTRYRYDSARQLVGVVGPDPDDAGPLKHRAVRATYRSDGLVTRVEQGTVDSQSDTDWAAFVSLEEVQQDYDSNDRPTVQRLVSGTTTHELAQTGYDGLGRVRCVAQRMNPAEFASLPADACTLDTEGSFGPDRIARTSYDAAGQVTQVETGVGTSATATEVAAAYTDNGLIDHVTDANGNRTTYEYDGHDRLTRMRFPVTTVGADQSSATDYEELIYESVAGGTRASPLVVSRRLRDTSSIGFAYDNLGRLIEVDRPGSEPTIDYGYDLLGRMTSASQTGHALTFAWDALGRPVSETGPLGTLARGYDQAGRMTTIIHPDEAAFTYEYDVLGELTGVFAPFTPLPDQWYVIRYVYDDRGRRIAETRGAGEMGSSSAYGWDPVSRLSSIADDLRGTADDVSATLGHGPAGQIVSRTLDNDAYAFTGLANQNVSDSHDGLNRVVATGGTSVGHDARGNVTAIGAATYGYDSADRLTSAPGGVSLGYDPLGRLFEVTGAGGTTRFLYDGFSLIGEYDGTGAMQRRHVHGAGIDEPVMTFEGAAIDLSVRRYLHADERGSIVAVVNPDGSLAAVNRYDEYGVPQTPLTGRFGYTGQTWLPEAELWYYRARMYNPDLGRFMQTDPIGYAAGMNLYAYVGNDPVNWVDPWGLTQICRMERDRGGWVDSTDPLGPVVTERRHEVCDNAEADGLGFWGPFAFGGGGSGRAPQDNHRYRLTVVTQCSASRAFESVRAAGNSAPGAPYAREGTHDIFLTDILPWRENPITQAVNVGRRTIRNETGEAHRFHPGSVTITVNDLGGNYSSIHIVGQGSGDHPMFNNIVGATFFGGMANAVADYCAAASGHPNIKN